VSDPSADCSDCARLSPDSDHAAQRDADATVLSGQAGDVNWVLQRLQSVFNAAARLVFSARKSEHITPLLRELHWLKVPERNQFRLCLLAYHCLIGTAPSYLAEILHLTADVGSRRRLRSASTSTLVIPSTQCTTLMGDRAQGRRRRSGHGLTTFSATIFFTILCLLKS